MTACGQELTWFGEQRRCMCACPARTCDMGRVYAARVSCACRRYITAVYWAYTTMTTVGYGDIYGTTIAEKARTQHMCCCRDEA